MKDSRYAKAWRAVGGLIAVASASLLASCADGEETAPEMVRPAVLHVVEAPSDSLDVSFPAIIEAGRSSVLTFQVGGLMEQRPVREGQEVRRGQVIARLDPARYQAAVNSAQAQFTVAQTEYEGAARLLEEDAIARIVVEQRRAQRDVARAALDAAQKDLVDTVLRAPFSGRIAETHVSEFTNVQPLQDIVTLQSIGDAEATVSVPASLLQQLARHEDSQREAYIVFSSAPDLRIPGTFRSLETQGDTQSQTFEVRFAFSPPAELVILPGMTGTVYGGRELMGDEIVEGAVEVPLGAVLIDGARHYVWIVDRATMTVSRREIETAEDVGEDIQVLSGLEAGETIVAAGAPYLHDGMQIRPYQP